MRVGNQRPPDLLTYGFAPVSDEGTVVAGVVVGCVDGVVAAGVVAGDLPGVGVVPCGNWRGAWRRWSTGKGVTVRSWP